MSFTALHRALGLAPGPLTDEILDDAVAAGVAETSDLDWKSELPPAKGLPQTDFPKDVAAMANSGGGLIVYGVRESQKAATERVDVGELSETYERSLRSVANTAITPPMFGLNVHRLGTPGSRAVVVEVPASVDGPHLIYRNDYFGAPVRNDSDTVWMKERQIEAMYRARFDERRHAAETLNALFAESAAGRDHATQVWLIAVAHPRVPRFRDRLTQEGMRAVLKTAESLTLTFSQRGKFHPLERMDRDSPRPGLRRWVVANTSAYKAEERVESWGSIHHDGSVTLATVVGQAPAEITEFANWWIAESMAIECAIADFMAFIRATAAATDNDEYDVKVGITWSDGDTLKIVPKDIRKVTFDEVAEATPLRSYTPVETTVNAAGPDRDYHEQVYDLARDCVNQGGVSQVIMIRPPARTD